MGIRVAGSRVWAWVGVKNNLGGAGCPGRRWASKVGGTATSWEGLEPAPSTNLASTGLRGEPQVQGTAGWSSDGRDRPACGPGEHCVVCWQECRSWRHAAAAGAARAAALATHGWLTGAGIWELFGTASMVGAKFRIKLHQAAGSFGKPFLNFPMAVARPS